MKTLLRGLAACCLLSASLLAGCSTVGTDLTNAVNYIDSPATQQAVATIKSAASAIVCAIPSASALAQQVEVIAGASTGVTAEIYAGSTDVCAALGGSVVSTTPVANVQAVTALTPIAVSGRLRARFGVQYVTVTIPAVRR